MILVESLRQSCQQIIGLLTLVDDDAYRRNKPDSSPVGGQVWHMIDSMNCLFDYYQNNLVDYDKRIRNIAMEQDRSFAQQAVEAIIKKSEQLETTDLQQEIYVQETINNDFAAARCKSNLEREIVDLIDHNTHHLAIIKILLADLNIKLAENFGVASSTVKHLNN